MAIGTIGTLIIPVKTFPGTKVIVVFELSPQNKPTP